MSWELQGKFDEEMKKRGIENLSQDDKEWKNVYDTLKGNEEPEDIYEVDEVDKKGKKKKKAKTQSKSYKFRFNLTRGTFRENQRRYSERSTS